jgi:hypothetical protein
VLFRTKLVVGTVRRDNNAAYRISMMYDLSQGHHINSVVVVVVPSSCFFFCLSRSSFHSRWTIFTFQARAVYLMNTQQLFQDQLFQLMVNTSLRVPMTKMSLYVEQQQSSSFFNDFSLSLKNPFDLRFKVRSSEDGTVQRYLGRMEGESEVSDLNEEILNMTLHQKKAEVIATWSKKK